MLKKDEIRYGYNDVMIQPARRSDVEHRSQCCPFDENGMLPIFTAPMSTVVNVDNYQTFYDNKIFAIIPRNIDWETRKKMAMEGKWVAVSLNEFEEFFCNADNFFFARENHYKLRILIDVANGNMSKIFNLSVKAKMLHQKKIEIMAGNIANPETYIEYCNSGIDYVRVSIGGGAGCITSSNTGIHDGTASLLDDIYKNKQFREKHDLKFTKVVADGGIRNYSDVIKALALGADYVMIGSVLAQTLESAGDTFYKDKNTGEDVKLSCQISYKDGKFIDEFGHSYDKLYKEFYGMASKYGQIAINGKKTKTSEGIKKVLEVTTTLQTWCDNMAAYLRSAMSYCNVYHVKAFNPNNVSTVIISNNVQGSINK